MKKKKPTKAILKKKARRLAKKEFKKKLEDWKLAVIERDNCHCQKCSKDLTNQRKHCHHIISLQNVKRKYPELLLDIQNGVLLCSYCHKFSPSSPHTSALEFCLWLQENKPKQYEYLKNYLLDY